MNLKQLSLISLLLCSSLIQINASQPPKALTLEEIKQQNLVIIKAMNDDQLTNQHELQHAKLERFSHLTARLESMPTTMPPAQNSERNSHLALLNFNRPIILDFIAAIEEEQKSRRESKK